MTLAVTAAQPGDARSVDTEAFSEQRFPTRVVVAAMALSIALRARFLTTPLTADEGGYLAVARSWASGRSLYTAAWVDRPQGLLVLFRLWDDVTGGSPAAIRVMAMLFGCLAVGALAYTAWAIAGARAAAIAAVLVAVASANARIEGFIANGELLAGAVAAAGVAAACAYMFRGHGRSWLLVGGVLAGCAMSLKQSGFDGFVAVMVCLLAGGLTQERAWRQVLRDIAICVAGIATVLAALVIHGALVGFSAWWYAVAGYRLSGINATSRADWHRFGVTARLAAPTMLPLIAVALAGLAVWLVGSRRITRSAVLVPAWMCFAGLAFVTGGLFHRHYWVTLTFPLAAAAAVALASITARIADAGNRRVLVAAAVCVMIVASMISTMRVVVLERGAASLIADDDPRLVSNELVGDWYLEHRTPGSTLYALCASAALYPRAEAIPPFPYLWFDGVLHGRGSQRQLVQLFSGDRPPTFVVTFQTANACNSSGEVDALVRQRYITRAVVDDRTILELRDSAAAG
jgi:hypothetical protein